MTDALYGRGTPRTFEGLEAQHTKAIAAGSPRSKQIRSDARKLAARLGVDCPAWAALGASPPKPERPKLARAALSATVAEYVSQPIELPEYPGVRAWAKAAPVGERALSLRTDGSVTLISWHDVRRLEASFSSEAEALAAIANGAVDWRPPRARPAPMKRKRGMAFA